MIRVTVRNRPWHLPPRLEFTFQNRHIPASYRKARELRKSGVVGEDDRVYVETLDGEGVRHFREVLHDGSVQEAFDYEQHEQAGRFWVA